MATQQTQVLGRALLTPAVALLFIWMIVPLAMTIYFSTLHYNLLDPGSESFVGLENFRYFLTDPAFIASLQNTLVLVCSGDHSLAARPRGAAARPAGDGAQHRAPDGDRAVLRHADRERAGVEEP